MKKKVTVVLQSRTKCKLIGVSNSHTEILYGRYGIKHPSAHFNPKYKLGSWDGFIRFYHKNGDTHIALLDEIVPDLVEWGYDIAIVTAYDPVKGNIPDDFQIDEQFCSKRGIFWDNGSPVELYDHQVRVVNALLKNKMGVADAATGAGKTLISACLAHIANDHGHNCLIVVPTGDLVQQTSLDLKEFRVDCGQYGNSVRDVDHPTVVATWQSLKNQPSLVERFGMIIVDETHGDKNDSVIEDLLTNYANNAAYVFGLTGTVPLEGLHRRTILNTIGPVVVTVSAKELMDKGVLATVEIDIVKFDEDVSERYQQYIENSDGVNKIPSYKEFKQRAFGEYTAEAQFIRTNKRRIQKIAELVNIDRERGNVLILVDNIQFGKKLTKEIGNGAVFLSGSNKTDERKKQYDRFQIEDGVCVVANAAIASTGLNIKRVNFMYLIDMGKSFTRVIQGIGRGVRVTVDKKSVIIRDIGSDLKYGKRHRTARKRYYKNAEYKHSERTLRY